MKWYVLMLLFLLVGFVWHANAQQAQQVDSNLVGRWECTDTPCNPCVLTIASDGAMSFMQGGAPVQLVYSRINSDKSINLLFPLGGKADLELKGQALLGQYHRPQQAERYMSVGFYKK